MYLYDYNKPNDYSKLNDKETLELLSTNGLLISSVEKTPERCIAAAKADWRAILRLDEEFKTVDVCLTAIYQNAKAMSFIPNSLKNESFWLESVITNGLALKYIPKSKQTYDIVENAINNNPLSLEYAAKKFIDEALIKKAVSINGLALEYVPSRLITDEIINLAISSNGLAIRLLSSPSEELCNTAFENNPASFQFFPEDYITFDMCVTAIESNADLISCVPYNLLNQEICNIAVEKGASLSSVPSIYIDADMCLTAVKNNSDEIDCVPENILVTILKEVAKTSWKAYLYLPLDDFTSENIKDFFNLVIKEINSTRFFPYEKRELINRIVSEIPKQILASVVADEKIVELLKCLRVVDEIRKYNDTTKTFMICEEVFGTEINQIILNDFDEYYNYAKTEYDGKIFLKPFEGIETFDKSILEKYILNPSSEGDYLYKYSESEKDKHFQTVIENKLDKIAPSGVENDALSIPVHDIMLPTDEFQAAKIYYISDVHFIHKIKKDLKSYSYNEIRNYMKYAVEKMKESIVGSDLFFNPLLLVGGDVSSDFEITRTFYETLAHYWQPERIIAILGNHELWGFDCDLEEIVEKYRKMFEDLRITFLHNEILFIDKRIPEAYSFSNGNRKTYFKMSYKEMLEMDGVSENEIKKKFCKTSYAILGGLGFSGLERKFNASVGIYRNAIKSCEQDLEETKKFSNLYNCALKYFGDKQVIVLTHTPMSNWSNQQYHNGWIYVSGHTHNNKWEENGDIRVYSDNQLGYESTSYFLKYFYINSINYDIFEYFKDGKYTITNEQYLDFNRGLGLSGNLNRDGTIHMIKKNGVYCFFFENQKRNKLQLLNGGRVYNLEHQDLDYYYNNMDAYSNMIKAVAKSRQEALITVSKMVKQIGGSGRIHGSIVDIDFLNHIYLNLFDGTLTPYFATSIKDKYTYSSIPLLLKEQLPQLYNNYLKLLKSDSSIIQTVNTNEISVMPIHFESTEIYRPSSIMLRIQALLDKNVIRIWDESLFDMFLPDKRID